MKTIISGNYIHTSYFATNGTMHVQIGLSDTGDNEACVVFEDGLYKALKNGELVMAATNCVIEYKDSTKQ